MQNSFKVFGLQEWNFELLLLNKKRTAISREKITASGKIETCPEDHKKVFLNTRPMQGFLHCVRPQR